jgi:hypothetical protein
LSGHLASLPEQNKLFSKRSACFFLFFLEKSDKNFADLAFAPGLANSAVFGPVDTAVVRGRVSWSRCRDESIVHRGCGSAPRQRGKRLPIVYPPPRTRHHLVGSPP